MRRDGWDLKPGVEILAGRWQDVLPQLVAQAAEAKTPPFDAVFFDTFAEGVDELRRFHTLLPSLLQRRGVYSYFNGIAAHDVFLHKVYAEAIRLDLLSNGFTKVAFVPVSFPVPEPQVWEGTSLRHWWLSDNYQMPACYM
uniref:Uncharacterized protein n=2 Tax=Chrysotila carterae TaxID=13221 RepID=A0A7S4EXG6_CHRCT